MNTLDECPTMVEVTMINHPLDNDLIMMEGEGAPNKFPKLDPNNHGEIKIPFVIQFCIISSRRGQNIVPSMVGERPTLHELIPRIPSPPIVVLDPHIQHKRGEYQYFLQNLDKPNVLSLVSLPCRPAERHNKSPTVDAIP